MTDWIATARTFAEEHLAPRTDLHTLDDLPDELWDKMAAAGLLSLTVPREFGGAAIDAATQIAAIEGFVRAARNLGVSSVLQAHLAHASFVIDRLGTPEQRARYLPAMARGEETLAVSISEPGAGAHPKHLKTRAEPDGDGWRLFGEKSYLTNGPRATVIAVLAITGEEAGRKRYSIFLVPKGADGLTIVPGGNVDYLKPSAHCGLKLDGVRVGPEALIGPLGNGYDLLGKPMRDHEDLLNLGSRFGSLAAELDALQEACGGEFGEHAEAFGGLIASLQGLKAVARVALEAGAGSAEAELLLLDIRERTGAFQDAYGGLIEVLGVTLPPREAALKRDRDRMREVAGYVQKIRLERLAAGWS